MRTPPAFGPEPAFSRSSAAVMRPLKPFGTDRRERGLQLVSTKETSSAFIRLGKTIVEISGTDFAVRQTD
jgi:hypothetical protein